MTYQYRESRIAYVGTTRRVALDPLEFLGLPIVALEPEDAVTYTVLNEDQSVLQPTTEATYGVVMHDTRGVPISAWHGLVAVGIQIQTLTVVWEVTMQGSTELFVDKIEVVAGPYQDRTLSLVAHARID